MRQKQQTRTANKHTMRMMRAGGSPNRSAPYAPSPQLRAQAPSRGVPPPTPETHSRPIGRSGERLRPIGRALFVGYRFVLRCHNGTPLPDACCVGRYLHSCTMRAAA